MAKGGVIIYTKKKDKKDKGKKYKRLTMIQYILLIFLSVVLITPFAQNRQFQTRMGMEIEEFRKQDHTEEIKDMQEVNQHINESGNFYTEDPFAGTTVYEDRANMIGVLSIPKIDEELSVYDRTDNLSLREGVGLLDGTHQPTGGIGNTTVLTGHDGMADASIFRNLDKLEFGDTFTFDNGEEILTYEVYEVAVVLPHETDVIQQIPDQDTMILLTCDTPDITKGINTHRLIVYGQRIPTVEQQPKESKLVTQSNQRYILFGTMGILLLVLIIVRLVYKGIKNKEENKKN